MKHKIVLPIVVAVLLGFWGANGGAVQKSKPRKTATQKTAPLDATLQAALKSAPKTSEYDYVRLLDVGKAVVKPDGTVVGEYRETYKLFNERARALAEVSVPFNSSYQKVRLIKAQTIQKSGTILQVKPSDVRTSSPFSEYLMYDDALSVGFSMPGIEDGCVIDYTYEITTEPLLMPGQFWAYWGFSDTVPVSLSRYTLVLPANKPIHHKVYNDQTLKPTVSRSADGKTTTYVWERRDPPPIMREPAMPSMTEVRIWMEASSLPQWDAIAKWFWGLAKPQAIPNVAIRETVAKLIANKPSSEAKARAIYDWVANRTRYVGLEFGISAYKPHAAAEVHKNLYGDCKDKSLLLVTMFEIAGLKAHPALLKAGDMRRVSPGLPTLNAFNHCIAWTQINGKEYWLDSTAETCAFGDIPEGVRGAEALIVRDGKGEFKVIPAYSASENGAHLKSQIVLMADGAAAIQSEIQMQGGMGQSMRAAVRSVPPSRRKEMMQRLAVRFFPGGKLDEYSLPDGNDKEGAFVMTMKVSAPNYAEQASSLLLVPIGSVTGDDERAHPFTQEERVWDIVENDNLTTTGETTLLLPQGYTPSEPPADISLSCPLLAYNRTLRLSEDGKTLVVSEKLEEKAGRMKPAEYPQLRAFYTQLLKVAKSRLVLKEVKP